MKHTKRTNCILASLLAVCLLFTACGKKSATETGAAEAADRTEKIENAFQDLSGMNMSFSDRDLDSSYDADKATKIVFGTAGASVTGSGAKAAGSEVVITEAGTYLLSGESENGNVTVSLGDEDKAQLVLNGLDLTSVDGPALRILSGDKVFITLAKGSENALADGDEYELEDNGSTLDGAVFSKSDLSFNGTGSLVVNGNNKHGIVSKDDLVFAGGSYTVTAEKSGVCGKDCVKITASDLKIDAGTDGIKSDNDEDENRGFIYIKDGSFEITAGNDALQAETVLKIEDGDFTVTTGGGSGNASSTGQGQFNDNWGYGRQSGSTTSESSAKGLKAGSDMILENGSYTLNTADDCLHSNGSLAIEAGSFTLSSGDDGVHADNALAISSGTITVLKSYEGIEANDIGIYGGTISVTASDDGLNAAGGNDSSAAGERPGRGNFSDTSDSSITIAGGYILIDAGGDGVDSNGTVAVTGGVTLVSGPTNNGNGAFDYGKSASVSGGTLVALGSSGMATGFTEAANQGAILINFDTQNAGTNLALKDGDGKAVVSFTGKKQYQSAVITCPGIQSGKTYTLVAGGMVQGADENGYGENASITGGTEIATIEMTSSLYGSGAGGFPGGQGGRQGFTGQNGNGDTSSFPGQNGEGSMPTPPDGNGSMPGFPGQDGSGQSAPPDFPGQNGQNGGNGQNGRNGQKGSNGSNGSGGGTVNG